MHEQDHVAILDAMAELGHLENCSGRDEAMRVAIAQMCAGALFLEAHVGKQRANQIVVALWRGQMPGDPIPEHIKRDRQ
ncbi:hypothetical protein [Mesorhizobium erdmanii]|nr:MULTISPECIES: hypothetical protein [Mesorhizobium]OBQ58630.1 hypothetical protein A8146_22135 [Mesorhizobium loti]